MNHDLYVTASGERDTSDSENAEEAARAMVSEDDVYKRVNNNFVNFNIDELRNELVSMIVAIGMDTPDAKLYIDNSKEDVQFAIDVEVQNIIATRNAR